MKKIFFLSIIIFALSIYSCDIIDPPYVEEGGTVIVDTNKKNVLIEYYTGAKCGNCPPAAEVGKQLEKLYPGKVIMIGNHVGIFSFPEAEGQKYEYNFRSEIGLEIDKFYNVASIGTPQGIINRTNYKDELVLSYSKWEAAVKAELEKSADVTIDLAPNYDETANKIELSADINYFKNSSSSHKLVVYIIEDEIVKYQKWYNHDPENISDYVHHNTIRSSMNGAWGDNLEAFSEKSGGTINKTLEFIIPVNADWNLDHIKLLAIVYEENATKTILNSEIIDLK